MSWHIIPLKFSNWNIICFGKKEPINVQFFRLLGALMKVHPIPHVIFETTGSGFIQTLHHCSLLWKITPLYFLAEISYTLDKNSPLKWNFTAQVNFRRSTAQVKFHQICTLTGYVCWKYIMFQLKKVWSKYVSWYQRVVQNLKKNLLFVSKMTRIWWILIWALKSLKILHFDWSFLCKVCNVWPKKVQRSMFHDNEESCKIWRKTDLWFGKRRDEFIKFSSEHLKMSKLVFSWDPFAQSRKCMSYKLTEEL